MPSILVIYFHSQRYPVNDIILAKVNDIVIDSFYIETLPNVKNMSNFADDYI